MDESAQERIGSEEEGCEARSTRLKLKNLLRESENKQTMDKSEQKRRGDLALEAASLFSGRGNDFLFWS